mmetsp:Transcript_58381/g.170722  ORF Transcript_58381/g.170722 Transcript_58381/m.170722 type:complete len:260 (+) Transcript_58381:118-897(+)
MATAAAVGPLLAPPATGSRRPPREASAAPLRPPTGAGRRRGRPVAFHTPHSPTPQSRTSLAAHVARPRFFRHPAHHWECAQTVMPHRQPETSFRCLTGLLPRPPLPLLRPLHLPPPPPHPPHPPPHLPPLAHPHPFLCLTALAAPQLLLPLPCLLLPPLHPSAPPHPVPHPLPLLRPPLPPAHPVPPPPPPPHPPLPLAPPLPLSPPPLTSFPPLLSLGHCPHRFQTPTNSSLLPPSTLRCGPLAARGPSLTPSAAPGF